MSETVSFKTVATFFISAFVTSYIFIDYKVNQIIKIYLKISNIRKDISSIKFIFFLFQVSII